jgi:hypothetical protein
VKVEHRAHHSRADEWGPVTIRCSCYQFMAVRDTDFEAGLAYESHVTGKPEVLESTPYQSTTSEFRSPQPLGAGLTR